MSSQGWLGQEQTQPLTFGIEFEFLVAKRQRRLNPDPHPEDRRWTVPFGGLEDLDDNFANEQAETRIQRILARNGIPALCGRRYGVAYNQQIRTEVEQQRVHPRPNAKQVGIHAFWMVQDDQSVGMIEGEDIDGYDYVEMEVASRILPETDFAEVELVYALIQSNIRTQVNSSCGLHCHIGIRHLSLESLQKLVTLLMVAEYKGLFATICAPYRSYSPTSRWCKPVSRFSRAVMEADDPPGDQPNPRLEQHLPPNHGLSSALFLALTRIWNCICFNQIVEQTLTCNEISSPAASGFAQRGSFAVRRPKAEYNTEGIDVNSDPTIEFRHKESTGSAAEDSHWVKLCLHLVRVAEWSDGSFRVVMGNLSTANRSHAEDLLKGLGLGDDEVQWWRRMAERHRAYPYPSIKTEFLVPENVSNSGSSN